ncbi:[methyl-Co(III) methanol-specific corrinoid protein]:coenzyme M methyltransferase [Desulfosalsimonas propionicica]|uniref:[methyl-Co(III) methanol-specific corrinoid protein]:coenzyme M methyltransferase n=1 Tax=Desulfosalsimonas propionicica TaxID=332175 RepID=A0A7W0CBW4_9BACT|nr:uroporphyrinogen decarboxylase family protein [Desulfosalsimonas propionicica]MBA2882807.1 [methyl-Co(III) methanol-specific corrinoid protein]:coenzyme M methyltransferase [Desulfosalsimonas propionicica]
MAELTSKERVLKLFRKEAVDTMPFFSGMSMLPIQVIDEMGIRFAQIHTSAEYMAESALKSARMFGFDSTVIPYDMCTIPEALGRGINLYDKSEGILFPTVPTKWQTLAEVEIPSDFMEQGRMPMIDQAYKKLIDESKNGEFAVGAWLLGPFTMAGQVIELDLLLKGAKKYKEQVDEFLRKMTDVVIAAGQHYQSLGVDFINIREMGSGTDILSPRMWKTLIQPNLIKVFNALNSPKVLHICGSTDMIIEMMNECGADALSVDQKNNVVESRKKLGNETLIFGNFDPFGTLVTNQDPAFVETTVKQCIDDGVDAVWPGCDLWPDMPKENVEALVQSVKKYGIKPSPAVGRLG